MAKCIIVDDSKFMRKIISDILVNGGHIVCRLLLEKKNGIDLYAKEKPDFLTMDITMGGKDGINAVREIKKKYPESRIIVISALNENTIKMNDEKINADAFLTKPFTKEELLSLVNKMLS